MDYYCLSECDANMVECISGCPCQAQCPGGCDECNSAFCKCQSDEPSNDQIECEEQASIELGDCILSCNGGQQCISTCLRAYDLQLFNCPCNEGCPNGCPCESYECPVTTTVSPTTTTAVSQPNRSVLVLSTTNIMNGPIIIDIDGNQDARNFFFKFGDDTEAFCSCSLIYKGIHYVFGGRDEKRQISKIDSCALKRIGSLPFDMYGGGCTVANDLIFIGFGDKDGDSNKGFHSTDSPLGPFTGLGSSIYSHSSTQISSSESK